MPLQPTNGSSTRTHEQFLQMEEHPNLLRPVRDELAVEERVKMIGTQDLGRRHQAHNPSLVRPKKAISQYGVTPHLPFPSSVWSSSGNGSKDDGVYHLGVIHRLTPPLTQCFASPPSIQCSYPDSLFEIFGVSIIRAKHH